MKQLMGKKLLGRVVLAIAAASALFFSTAIPASAYTTNSLLFYYDFSTLSAASDGTVLTDLSGNGRNGTVVGNLSYDSTSHALSFPGGSHGTNYVSLGGSFNNFSTGLTLEFEGEFGVTRANWERIFDFGIDGGANDDVWVGQFDNSNELTIEVWKSGVNQGRCTTNTSGQALGVSGSRAFAKWMITLDGSLCRIYKNGTELPTQLLDADGYPTGITGTNGIAYPLPNTATRTHNFLGRSNWPDADFEGSIRYIRIYGTALSADDAADNALNSSTPSENSSGSEAPTLASTGAVNGSSPAGLIAGGVLALVAGALLIVRRRLSR